MRKRLTVLASLRIDGWWFSGRDEVVEQKKCKGPVDRVGVVLVATLLLDLEMKEHRNLDRVSRSWMLDDAAI